MSFYGIKDNKCRIDLTERTPEITTIEDLGFTVNSSLTLIINSMTENGILIFSVSNVTNTSIYPMVIPEDDAAIVIINKVGNSASVEFHFYDSFYTNQYSYIGTSILAGWIRIGKATEFSITTSNIPSQSSQDYHRALNVKGNHAIVTMANNYGFIGDKQGIDYTYCILNKEKFILHVRNNTNSTITGLTFNVCIL